MANPATTLTGNPFSQLDLPEGLTRSLIDLVRDIDLPAVPSEVRSWAKHSLIDTLGCIALGSVAGPVRMLRRVVLTPRATDGATDGATDCAEDCAEDNPAAHNSTEMSTKTVLSGRFMSLYLRS